MCIVLFSYNSTPGYRLILAANRDEFYSRPTAPLSYWDDKTILAGKDLQEGGTWLGITTSGKLGVLTNFRENVAENELVHSRGDILRHYLSEKCACQSFLEDLRCRSDNYRGFNLLIGDENEIYHYSNRTDVSTQLKPGIYGLSNHLLDTPWPKVVRGKSMLKKIIERRDVCVDDLFNVLKDTCQPNETLLPSTGVGKEWEKLLAPIFIRSQNYGTRSSAVLTIADNGVIEFHERTYLRGDDEPKKVSENSFTITDTNWSVS